MPSMMTTYAAHQVQPEAHAVVFCVFKAFIDTPLLEEWSKKSGMIMYLDFPSCKILITGKPYVLRIVNASIHEPWVPETELISLAPN